MDSSQNNPFNNFNSGGTIPGGISSPMDTGARGDIVLADDGQKSKKKLIIGIVVGVVILAVALMAFIFMQGGKVNVSGSGKDNYNRYMNYLLYGNDSTEGVTGEYNEGDLAEIYNVMGTDHKTMMPYSTNLRNYWDEFYKNSSDFKIDENATRDDYDKRVKFIATYFDNSLKVDEDKIVDIVVSGSSSNVENVLADYFSQFEQFDFSEAKTFVKNGKLYYNTLASVTETLIDAGCQLVDNNDVNAEVVAPCDEETILADDDDYASLNDYYVDMTDALDKTVRFLVEDSWKINTELNGGKK